MSRADTPTIHIRETVKALREQRKLTQAELAVELNVKQAMISQQETR